MEAQLMDSNFNQQLLLCKTILCIACHRLQVKSSRNLVLLKVQTGENGGVKLLSAIPR